MTTKHQGGCHCGKVRYEVTLDLTKPASRCNCTVCTKLGATGAIVKPEDFTLLAGEADTSVYEWGGRTGRRYFCKHCGVHCYQPGHLVQLGGDYIGINLNTIDDLDVATLQFQHWDGRHNNWMAGPRATPWAISG